MTINITSKYNIGQEVSFDFNGHWMRGKIASVRFSALQYDVNSTTQHFNYTIFANAVNLIVVRSECAIQPITVQVN